MGCAAIARFRQSGSPACQAIADLMQFYLTRQGEMYGLTLAPMHDVCAIIPYVYPDLIQFLHTSIRVELTGTYTRGMTVCDVRHPRGSAETSLRNRTEPNGFVAVSARSRDLIDRVIETLEHY